MPSRSLGLSSDASSPQLRASAVPLPAGTTPGVAASSGRSMLDLAYREESPSLLSYFDRRVGHEAAPDLVQEVFARAAGSAQVARLNNPAAFLRRIARNLLIDRSRRRASGDDVLLGLDDGRGAVQQPEQEQHLEALDLVRLYDHALDTLPEKTRRIFLMHRVDDLSYRAIHEELGLSIPAVEYHMMKALAHIARKVDAAR